MAEGLLLTFLGTTLARLGAQPPSKTRWQGPSLDLLPLERGSQERTTLHTQP